MSRDPFAEQLLALAGAARFALCAHQLAGDGQERPACMEAALHAIYCTDPDDAADVVGNSAEIGDGLRFLRRQLGRGDVSAVDATVTRYIGQILRLATRLMKTPEALDNIRGAIDRARLSDPNQAPRIFDRAYRENLSELSPRIMIQGHPTYLHNPQISAQIRTLLLAGVRCGVLWRQCGGRFWRLLMFRHYLSETLDRLLATFPAGD